MAERRKGEPRTEKERAARHAELYPGEELPPRGTGLARSPETKLARFPKTYHITVTTKKKKLVTENPTRKGLLVYNNGSATVYILSSPALDKTDGIPVAAGGSYENDDCYGEYWIVADSGSQDVRVEEDTD
ncbi:MAG: hypothetical protein JRE40_01690 [Deltaproteobacteria bacterium]|nr:hypothetical protein [Deltaproteobacteria bacterium]MBW2672517.1 hypothetical protein [Deltaproteobacteria bacterium]